MRACREKTTQASKTEDFGGYCCKRPAAELLHVFEFGSGRIPGGLSSGPDKPHIPPSGPTSFTDATKKDRDSRTSQGCFGAGPDTTQQKLLKLI